MNRRSMLKVLPLAALAGVSVKVGETEGKAFEMKPEKKYLFVLPDIPKENARLVAAHLRERGIDATVCSGPAGLEIYELEPTQIDIQLDDKAFTDKVTRAVLQDVRAGGKIRELLERNTAIAGMDI